MRTGVITLLYAFLRYLRQDEVAKRIGPLQLAGRIEEYLVKEFVQFVFQESKGSRFCDLNLGVRGEPKVDIAVRRAIPKGGEVLEGLIEAKYLQNRGRRNTNPFGKFDEIRSTLQSLRKQLEFKPGATQGKTTVRLRARSIRVYGLVFAGYARKLAEPDEHQAFLDRILRIANELGFSYHDLPQPSFRPAYRDLHLSVLGETWRVSLWGGLWRAREAA